MLETQLFTMERKRLQRLVRLIAAFEDKKITQITEEIAEQGVFPKVKNLARDAISVAFRSAVFEKFSNLSEATRIAIAEELFVQEPTSIAEPGQPETLRNDSFGLKAALRQFDLSLFDHSGFRSWPKGQHVHYLILRLHDSDKKIRLSRMEIEFGKGGSRIPLFTTWRRSELGADKRLAGIVLRTSNTIFTIGQLNGIDGLRVSRLRALHIPELSGGHRLDLYGLRLGRKARTERSFAHVVYARQITSDSLDALKELLDSQPGSIFDVSDDRILSFVPELRELLPKLVGEIAQDGIQPSVWD